MIVHYTFDSTSADEGGRLLCNRYSARKVTAVPRSLVTCLTCLWMIERYTPDLLQLYYTKEEAL